MKSKIVLLIFIIVSFIELPFTQVGINATNSAPDPSSMLDVNSTNKGILIPRMTTIQKNAIANKIEGLTVYDTDLKQFSYWTDPGTGGLWQNFGAGGGSNFALPYSATLTNSNILFNLSNSLLTNTSPVIRAETSSIADNAVSIYGELSGNAPNDTCAAIKGVNTSLGSYGSGVFGKAIYGKGISGYSFAGTGVYGYTTYGNAIVGRTDATGGYAGAGVNGLSLGGTGNIAGVHGESNSTTNSDNPLLGAVGVNGIISSISAGKYSAGVRGINNAVSNGLINYPAIGVMGISNASVGWGVMGQSDAGYAVIGNSTSGFGVHGASVSGKGVYGYSNNNDAVYGNSVSGYGVHGTSGSSNGVYGYSLSNHGVFGESDASYGIYGYSFSSHGVSGQSTSGIGTVGVSTGNDGVYGSSNMGRGVVGVSVLDFGVSGYSSSNNGVYGEVSGSFAAVRGVNLGAGFGIHGQSNTGYGIYGNSTSNHGVYGSSSNVAGIQGHSQFSSGVAGYSSNSDGVFGSTGNPSAYAVYSNGNAYKTQGGSSWTVPSDLLLKKDIKPFTDGLNIITQIQPKRYHYNGMAGTNANQEEFGIIAQDMQKIAPYTIFPRKIKLHESDKDSTEILTYNSSSLTYVIINSVKELNEENKVLKERLLKLESSNAELKSEIAFILKQISHYSNIFNVEKSQDDVKSNRN